MARFRQLLLALPGVIILLGSLALGACRTQPPVPASDTGTVVILVEADGITAVSRDALSRAGFSVERFEPAGMRLTQDGHEVPFLVQDDRLVFYGQASSSRTAAVTPYILEPGAAGTPLAAVAAQASLQPVDAVAVTLRLEENVLYTPEAQATAPEVEPWFWQAIPQGATAELEADLPAVAGGAGELEVALWGFTEAAGVSEDHDLDVLVNGQKVGRAVWDGRAYHTTTLALPEGTLRRGRNTITLDNSAAGAVPLDIIHLDYVALRYHAPAKAVDGRLRFTTASGGQVALEGFGGSPPLALDITTPQTPRQLAVDAGTVSVPASVAVAVAGPEGYLEPLEVRPRLPAGWLSPTAGADLVIVADDSLMSALQPLVDARRSEGLTVQVVAPQAIGDHLGGGVLTPEALNRFVAHIVNEWPAPEPRYLLLVGDATLDYRGYASDAPPYTIPSALVPAAFSGETVSDARLADVDGDHLPDVAVGRWPVRDAAEVAALVERTLAYEDAPPASRALFAIDASESRFAAMADRLAQANGLADATFLNGPAPRALLAEWNANVWLAAYIGHGSVDRWGQAALLTNDDVPGIAPATAGAPIVLQWTCLSGLFSQPDHASLSEILLRHPRGPVLVVGPTSLTLSDHQEPFAAALTAALTDPALPRAGDALLAATGALSSADPALLEISDTFVLFGDPSARVVRP